MPQVERVIGTKSAQALFFDTIKSELTRADALRAAGGFTVSEMMKATGFTRNKSDGICRRKNLKFEKAYDHKVETNVVFYFPDGCEIPAN